MDFSLLHCKGYGLFTWQHRTWELFKPSNGLASLQVCTRKKNFFLGFTDVFWV